MNGSDANRSHFAVEWARAPHTAHSDCPEREEWPMAVSAQRTCGKLQTITFGWIWNMHVSAESTALAVFAMNYYDCARKIY